MAIGRLSTMQFYVIPQPTHNGVTSIIITNARDFKECVALL